MTLDELNEHFELIGQLARAQEMIESLRAAACPASPILTGMPHASGVKDKVGDLAAEIAEMDTRIHELQKEIAESEKNVLEFIKGVKDDKTRLIFRLRFIRGLTWGEIAGVFGRYTTEASVKSRCNRYFRAEERNAEISHDTP